MSYDQQTADLERLLAEARKAWRAKLWAESKLQHLARYSRLTPAMKDERRQASTALTEATGTLVRILGNG